MKRSKYIVLVLVACIGIASTGFVSTRFICVGKKAMHCDYCKTAKSEKCCKQVADYSNVEIAAKSIEKISVKIPNVVVALVAIPSNIPSHCFDSVCAAPMTRPPTQVSPHTVVLRI